MVGEWIGDFFLGRKDILTQCLKRAKNVRTKYLNTHTHTRIFHSTSFLGKYTIFSTLKLQRKSFLHYYFKNTEVISCINRNSILQMLIDVFSPTFILCICIYLLQFIVYPSLVHYVARPVNPSYLNG